MRNEALSIYDRDSVFLTYTNARVNELNNSVRFHKLGIDSITRPYMVSEKIRWTKYSLQMNIRSNVPRYTGETDFIRNVETLSKNNELWNKEYNCYEIILETGLVIYKVIGDEYKEDLNTFLTNRKERLSVLRRRIALLDEGVERNILISERQSLIFEWDNIIDYIQKFDAPIEYCYALTIHTSQGSEYNKVFIDKHKMQILTGAKKNVNGKYILKSIEERTKGITEYLKLLYVACSRKREDLFIVI